MKILSAHQPAYLPWLGYFHKIASSDVFMILDDLQFEKNSFTNRNKIKGANGDFWLTVPVNLKGHFDNKIKDTQISGDPNWRKKHLKAIESSYQKSKYYQDYIRFFQDCYAKDWKNLSELTEFMLLWFLKQLRIETKICKMSDYQFAHKKSDLIIEICKTLDVNIYLFGKLGRNYADTQIFKQQGITAYFQEYTHPEYEQLHGDFIPYLSIIDLLFNHGADSLEILLKSNDHKNGLKRITKKGNNEKEHISSCSSS